MTRPFGILASCFCALALITMSAAAQTQAGHSPAASTALSLQGRITGEGAPVAGAIVTLTNVETKKALETKTDERGVFSFSDLKAGEYSAAIVKPGFKTELVQSILLKGSAAKLDQQLAAGPSSETETVLWTPMVEKAKAAEGEKTAILSSRNVLSSGGTEKGVSGIVNDATVIGVAPSNTYSVGGSTTNDFIVDGVSISNAFIGVTAPSMPNPDSQASHTMIPWSYDVTPVRYAGFNVVVTTKSGGKKFHGSIFEFDRNDIFNANAYFTKRQGTSRPVLKQNQFGFTVGGPVVQDKMYFFASYQGTRQSNGLYDTGLSSGVYLYPFPSSNRTAASVGAAMCASNHTSDSSKYLPAFYNPYGHATTVACDGSNINPVALAYLNLTNTDGSYVIPGSTTGDLQNHVFSKPATYEDNQFLINTDFVLSPKHALAEKFYFSRAPQTDQFAKMGWSLPGSPENILRQNIYSVLRLTSTLTPNFTNEFRLSAQRDNWNNTSTSAFNNSAVGVNSLASTWNQLDIVNILNTFEVGGTGTTDTNAANQYQIADSITLNKPGHMIQAGVGGALRQNNVDVVGITRGTMVFMSVADFLLGLPGCTPGDATCLAGTDTGSITTNHSSNSNVFSSSGQLGFASTSQGAVHSYRYKDMFAYVQDHARVTHNLAVNVGLRWDYFGPETDSTGNMMVYRPNLSPAFSSIASDSYAGYIVPSNFKGTLPTGAVRSSKKYLTEGNLGLLNISPRVGFTWKPFEKSDLLVLGGYGVFYDHLEQTVTELQTQAAAPYAPAVGGSGATNYLASEASPYACTSTDWTCAARSVSGDVSSNVLARGFDSDISHPKTQKWNLEIEKILPGAVKFSVGYAGAHSIHLQDIDRQINVARLASASAPVNGVTTNTVANVAQRVPYLGLSPSGLATQGTLGYAHHNTMMVSASKRFSSIGVFVKGDYAWTKTLSNIGAVAPIGGWMTAGTGYSMNTNDPNNPRQMYGATWMMPQRFTAHYGWTMPWRFKDGIMQYAFGGWGVLGNTVIQQGTPITVFDSRGGTIYGSGSNSRAQYCSGKGPGDVATSGSASSRIDKYFNDGVFCQPTVLSADYGLDYGNSGIGIVRQPGNNNTDLSITKRTKIENKADIEFRTEFYNVFNHAQFRNPDNGVTHPGFGRITATSVNPRLIQFGLKITH